MLPIPKDKRNSSSLAGKKSSDEAPLDLRNDMIPLDLTMKKKIKVDSLPASENHQEIDRQSSEYSDNLDNSTVLIGTGISLTPGREQDLDDYMDEEMKHSTMNSHPYSHRNLSNDFVGNSIIIHVNKKSMINRKTNDRKTGMLSTTAQCLYSEPKQFISKISEASSSKYTLISLFPDDNIGVGSIKFPKKSRAETKSTSIRNIKSKHENYKIKPTSSDTKDRKGIKINLVRQNKSPVPKNHHKMKMVKVKESTLIKLGLETKKFEKKDGCHIVPLGLICRPLSIKLVSQNLKGIKLGKNDYEKNHVSKQKNDNKTKRDPVLPEPHHPKKRGRPRGRPTKADTVSFQLSSTVREHKGIELKASQSILNINGKARDIIDNDQPITVPITFMKNNVSSGTKSKQYRIPKIKRVTSSEAKDIKNFQKNPEQPDVEFYMNMKAQGGGISSENRRDNANSFSLSIPVKSLENVQLQSSVLYGDDLQLNENECPPVEVHPDFSDELDRLIEHVVIPPETPGILHELPSDIDWDSELDLETDNEENQFIHFDENDDLDVLTLTVDPDDKLPMPKNFT